MTRTKRPIKRGNSTEGTKAGRSLIGAAEQALRAVRTGDWTGIRIRDVEIAEPGNYRAKDVRVLRDVIGVSQAVFACLVGVSPELVESWEQGLRRPAAPVRRLLDKISEDPAAFVAPLMRRREVARG
jgi:putative transcriptional regulator